jgi:hypothetical protein
MLCWGTYDGKVEVIDIVGRRLTELRLIFAQHAVIYNKIKGMGVSGRKSSGFAIEEVVIGYNIFSWQFSAPCPKAERQK